MRKSAVCWPRNRNEEGGCLGLYFDELIRMGLLSESARTGLKDGRVTVRSKYVPWANVIFHHQTREALDVIWNWLEGVGLVREEEESRPITDWSRTGEPYPASESRLIMSGRFGRWKYYWTDDCVLRGRQIADRLCIPPQAGAGSSQT